MLIYVSGLPGFFSLGERSPSFNTNGKDFGGLGGVFSDPSSGCDGHRFSGKVPPPPLSLSLSLYTFTANTRRKPRVLQNTQGFHWKPGVLLFSSFFAFEHVHTDASMSCLSIEATGVSSEDLRFFVPKSCSASDLKPVIFFTGLHG